MTISDSLSPSAAANAGAGAATLLGRLDPSASLRALVALDDPPRGLAEDALLGWLIALPAGVDPADAARALADLPELYGPSREARRLTALLDEVARFPAATLASAARAGRVTRPCSCSRRSC